MRWWVPPRQWRAGGGGEGAMGTRQWPCDARRCCARVLHRTGWGRAWLGRTATPATPSRDTTIQTLSACLGRIAHCTRRLWYARTPASLPVGPRAGRFSQRPHAVIAHPVSTGSRGNKIRGRRPSGPPVLGTIGTRAAETMGAWPPPRRPCPWTTRRHGHPHAPPLPPCRHAPPARDPARPRPASFPHRPRLG